MALLHLHQNIEKPKQNFSFYLCLLPILLIVIQPGSIFSQDIPTNLKKYWYYRENLKNYVYLSPNYNEAGTNIPAERISPDSAELHWDDGNGAFNQYISVLATEYRLLKDAGKDYSQTTKELFYALKSFERLDITAESKYRQDRSQLPGDLNGFFIRNDADDAFWNKYKKDGTHPYFKQNIIFAGDQQQNSLDNCIHYLESFALVKALVDNELVDGTEINFKQIAKDNTRRIIQNMQHKENPVPIIDNPLFRKVYGYTWYLKNPVTGELVPQRYGSGLDGTMIYASYGFTKAANRILDEKVFEEMKFGYEAARFMLNRPITEYKIEYQILQKRGIFPIPVSYKKHKFYLTSPDNNFLVYQYGWLPTISVKKYSDSKVCNIGQDDYKMRSLCSTGNIKIVKKRTPYQVLIKKQNESTVFKYEHFPLIWCVVNNKFNEIADADREYIKKLLDAASLSTPPYKIKENNTLKYGSFEWSSSSRLIWPENLGERTDNFLGYYNGLDYMLLHNLFWLTNKDRLEPGIYSKE
jgi:hypothetical protein